MNTVEDAMMNKVLAGEAGKEKAREWGRWLATDEGQAYLAVQMDADFFEEREDMDDSICEESRKRVFCNLQKKISGKRFAVLTLKVVAAMTPVAAVVAILLYLNTQVSLFEHPFYQISMWRRENGCKLLFKMDPCLFVSRFPSSLSG